MNSKVRYETEGAVATVTITRPEVRNCVDGETAQGLAGAFRRFEADETLRVAILTGQDGAFCAGADLKAVSSMQDPPKLKPGGDGPLGCSHMQLSKPVIAAVEGHAVAGGLELAIWCDLRVAATDATFGVYCRRFGVPLVDGGTIRLARLIGQSHALDMILTGRGVGGEEALRMGLANRLVDPGTTLAVARELAGQLAEFPQRCMLTDRDSCYRQWGLDVDEALRRELEGGLEVIRSGETREGATRFASGQGRHGRFS